MILDKIADYITELMNFDPTRVLIGRENATQETFTNDYIVVDILSPANVIGSNREYNYELEKETFYSVLKGRFTLEIYGSNNYMNAYKFINLQNSQLARDLQKKYEITIFKDITINNLKQEINGRYFDRYELDIMIQFYESETIDTYRIEDIPIEYVKE